MTDTRDKQFNIRLSEAERVAIEAAAGDRGESLAEALRAMPIVWSERAALVRAALLPMRGKYSAAELNLILDVMNGVHLLSEANDGELLGHHVVVEVVDGIRLNGLDKTWEVNGAALQKRIGQLDLASRVALELWCADLWKDSEDDDRWQREVAWLSGSADTWKSAE